MGYQNNLSSIGLHDLINLVHNILHISLFQPLSIELLSPSLLEPRRNVVYKLSWKREPCPLFLVPWNSIDGDCNHLLVGMNLQILLALINFDVEVREPLDEEVGEEYLVLGPGVFEVGKTLKHNTKRVNQMTYWG